METRRTDKRTMSKRLMAAVTVAGGLVVVGAVVLVASDDDAQDEATRVGERAVATCSASSSGTELEQPAGMPDAVYEQALAVARAATACDYDELTRLAGPDFQFSFDGAVGGRAAAAEWRASEARGEPVLRTLHNLLIGPYVFDGERYIWPSNDTTDWRIGIGNAGDWQFFVAGD